MLNTLIVEDDTGHRESMHRLLARRFPSLHLAEAANGKEALRQMGERHFDLVCLLVQQPQESDLVLIQAAKTFNAESVVCVIASHGAQGFREAALHHGADYFMVEGEATEAALVGQIELLLRPSFHTLIVDSDEPSRSQLHTLLSIRWPAMSVVEAADAATGIAQAAALKPNLVLLELGLPGEAGAEMARGIRQRSPGSTLVGLADDAPPPGRDQTFRDGVDYCVPLSPAGHTELMAIVKSLQPGRLQPR